MIHVDGSVDPARDIETINTELILADIETVQKRLDKAKRVIGDKNRDTLLERTLLEKIMEHLNEGLPIKTMDLNEEEEKLVNGYFLLTTKKVIYAANISEDDIGKPDNDLVRAVKEVARKENSDTLVISAKIEEEIAELSEEDRKLYLEEMGIEKSGLDRLITMSYDLLGLISFLTAGSDDVHAWTIKKGTKAPQAAGKIHTDFERGFIRAEIVSYEDLVREGSIKACREKGILRSEGKDYVMQDGDVTQFLFNV